MYVVQEMTRYLSLEVSLKKHTCRILISTYGLKASVDGLFTNVRGFDSLYCKMYGLVISSPITTRWSKNMMNQSQSFYYSVRSRPIANQLHYIHEKHDSTLTRNLLFHVCRINTIPQCSRIQCERDACIWQRVTRKTTVTNTEENISKNELIYSKVPKLFIYIYMFT